MTGIVRSAGWMSENGESARTENDGGNVSVLDRVAPLINSSLDLSEVLERLAALALEACPAHRCSIFLLNEAKSHLVPRTYTAHPDISEQIARVDYATRPHFHDMEPIDLAAIPSRSIAFEQGKAFPIADLAESPLVPQEVVRQFRARSAIIVPLIAPDEPLGILVLDWMTLRNEFADNELVLVEAIGSYASLAIRNAGLFERLDDKARSLESLVDVASSLNSSVTLRDVLELACSSFIDLLDAKDCSIHLSGEGPDALTAEQTAQLATLWRNSTEPLDLGLWADELGALSSLRPSSAKSIVLFPVMDAQEIRGLVVLSLSEYGSLDPDRLELGRALCGLTATAIERAELYESLRTQLRLMEVLHGLSDAVAGTSDLTSALRQLNHLLAPELGIELESISVASDRRRGVISDPDVAREMQAIRSWRAALATSQTPLRPQVSGDAVLVPIAHRGRVQGVLRVRPNGRVLEGPGEELVMSLGVACAEVIHKATLHQDLAESEHRLAIAGERERIARDLHDNVGQLITSLGMQLVEHAASAPDEEWRTRLEELAEQTMEGSRQIKEAIHSLLFFQVRRSGLVRSLRELAQTFEATSGIATSFEVRGEEATVQLEKEDALFRVAHEAFTNIRRHAGTPSASMTLTYASDVVFLAVRDQGKGFGRHDPLRSRPGHFGLHGLRLRIEEAGGELLVANAHPSGVLIEARIPVKRRRGSEIGPGRGR